MPVKLHGVVDRLTFQAEDTGWTVARLILEGERKVTAVGYLTGVKPGEHLELVGEWTSHPRYGPQLKVASFRPVVPASEDGIRKYLASGIVAGIGPVTADRIVETFGERTLDVLDKEPERLLEVEGIGKVRLKQIRSSWQDQSELRELVVFLQGHGMGPGTAAKVFKEYGGRSLDVVRRNPYRLALDIQGVGFLTADRLAESLGFDRTSVLRAEAGVLHVLYLATDQGNVCLQEDLLIEECEKLLEVSGEIVERGLRGLMDRGMAVLDQFEEQGPRYVYPKPLHAAEKGVCRGIFDLLDSGHTKPFLDFASLEGLVRERLGLDLSDGQKNAVQAALTNKVTVITGGPGTGKTTLVRAIIEIMNRWGQSVLLGAPTGRAAKRLAQSCEQEAKTIHRLLEFNPVDGRFKRNRDNPLRADAVIVDETSMVDIVLMNSLLSAVPAEAVLVLVGDVDQLPSVGPGSVLRDIIDSGTVPVIRLDQIFRQAQQSLIVVNAHRVNAGEWPLLHTEAETPDPDCFFVERAREEDVLESVLDLSLHRIRDRFGLDPMQDIQVLTPMNRGTLGVQNLNRELQKALNPGEIEIPRGDGGFRTGDKVMQLKNNYDKDIYNGDIGRIVGVDGGNRLVWVEYEGRTLSYDFSELDEVALAYAISIHKSQGSEYPAVIIPLMMQHYPLLQRNLIYTAITRGKDLVVLMGQKKALGLAIRNDRTRKRFGHLKERLIQAKKEAEARWRHASGRTRPSDVV